MLRLPHSHHVSNNRLRQRGGVKGIKATHPGYKICSIFNLFEEMIHLLGFVTFAELSVLYKFLAVLIMDYYDRQLYHRCFLWVLKYISAWNEVNVLKIQKTTTEIHRNDVHTGEHFCWLWMTMHFTLTYKCSKAILKFSFNKSARHVIFDF